MEENRLVEIPLADWPKLRDLYQNRKSESVSFNMIQNYIDWLAKDPSLDFAKFYSLNGDWSDGTFVLQDSYLIIFDIIDRKNESSRLYDALCLLDYSDLRVFNGYDSRLQSVVAKVIEHHHLNDNDTLNGGYDLYCLRQQFAVEFSESQQTGALGLLKVRDNYRRLGIASLLVTTISKAIAAKGQDVMTLISSDNRISKTLFEAIGFQKDCNYYIMVNTPNDSHSRLLAALHCLEKTSAYMFCGFPTRLRTTIETYMSQLGTKIDMSKLATTIWYHISPQEALKFSTVPPEGITLSALSQDDVVTINSIWPHRHPGSEIFIGRLIAFNPNIGAYDKDGNLLSWCLQLPIGALGVLHVKDGHKRKGYGSLMVRALSKKLVELGIEITAPVVETNEASRSMFRKLGFKEIDTVHWFTKPALE